MATPRTAAPPAAGPFADDVSPAAARVAAFRFESVPVLVFSGPAVQACREAAGLTTEQVAQAMGKHVRTITDWQKPGHQAPTAADMGRLASLLDCTVSDFFRAE